MSLANIILFVILVHERKNLLKHENVGMVSGFVKTVGNLDNHKILFRPKKIKL